MRLLVIGGSDAGISAALRARELDPGSAVTVLLADHFPNFSICGLPYLVSGEVPDWRRLAHRELAELEATGMEVRPGTRATRILPTRNAVEVEGPAGGELLPYERLVIATGARPLRPPLAGLDDPDVHVLHDVAHAHALLASLRRTEAREVVVIGAGYIGVELADALRHSGREVTLIERGPAPMPSLDPRLSARLAALMELAGVRLLGGQTVRSISRRGEELVVATPEHEVRAKVVVVTAGVTPSAELGLAAGASAGVAGALAVGRGMELGLPGGSGVYAAGDCAGTWHRLLGRMVWLPLGTTAHKQGRVAGENAVGGQARFEGTLGTQVVKVFGAVLGRTGLGDAEARREGLEPLTVELETWDHKAYYPGATRLLIQLTARAHDGVLLGAQVMGTAGAEVSKRLDLLAMAVHHRMTVEAMASLDLSYTPPLGSPWDPVQLVAQHWERERRGGPPPRVQGTVTT